MRGLEKGYYELHFRSSYAIFDRYGERVCHQIQPSFSQVENARKILRSRPKTPEKAIGTTLTFKK